MKIVENEVNGRMSGSNYICLLKVSRGSREKVLMRSQRLGPSKGRQGSTSFKSILDHRGEKGTALNNLTHYRFDEILGFVLT